MGVDRELWLRNKEVMYKRLLNDLHIGYLDEDIEEVLLEIFKRRDSYTVSSCSGRIVMVDCVLPWIRRNSTVVFKKHKPISREEFLDLLSKPILYNLWVVITSPIIHVVTADLKEARRILVIGREAGFKHSGIISIRRDGIILELRSGVGLTQIVKAGSKILVDISNVDELVSMYNNVLTSGKERLEKLKELLRKYSEEEH